MRVVKAGEEVFISVGLARIIYIYGVYTVFLAGKSPNIRSYTVCIYGSGQPYISGYHGATECEGGSL